MQFVKTNLCCKAAGYWCVEGFSCSKQAARVTVGISTDCERPRCFVEISVEMGIVSNCITAFITVVNCVLVTSKVRCRVKQF